MEEMQMENPSHTQKDLKQAQTKLISCHLESEDIEEINAKG